MNKIDQHVKTLMLSKPALFPTRWSVLRYIFLTGGTGYCWTEQGTVDCLYALPAVPDNVVLSDLDEELSMLSRYPALADSPLFKMEKLRVELRRRERKFIAKHIDLFASSAAGLEGLVLDDVLPVYWEGCLLGQIPSDIPLDKDWAVVAEEICYGVLGEVAAVSVLSKQKASAPDLAKLREQLKAALVSLDKTTGTASRRASLAAALRGRLQSRTGTASNA